MKFEVKTKKMTSRKILFFLLAFAVISLIVIPNISLKIGTISRHFEINYLCKLSIEKNRQISINYRN